MGLYDLTILPVSTLVDALMMSEMEMVKLRVPGQYVIHMVSRSSVEEVLRAKNSRAHHVVTT